MKVGYMVKRKQEHSNWEETLLIVNVEDDSMAHEYVEGLKKKYPQHSFFVAAAPMVEKESDWDMIMKEVTP